MRLTTPVMRIVWRWVEDISLRMTRIITPRKKRFKAIFCERKRNGQSWSNLTRSLWYHVLLYPSDTQSQRMKSNPMGNVNDTVVRTEKNKRRRDLTTTKLTVRIQLGGLYAKPLRWIEEEYNRYQFGLEERSGAEPSKQIWRLRRWVDWVCRHKGWGQALVMS